MIVHILTVTTVTVTLFIIIILHVSEINRNFVPGVSVTVTVVTVKLWTIMGAGLVSMRSTKGRSMTIMTNDSVRIRA